MKSKHKKKINNRRDGKKVKKENTNKTNNGFPLTRNKGGKQKNKKEKQI